MDTNKMQKITPMIGAPLQKSDGKNKKYFPRCSSIECWCRDCAYDSIDKVYDGDQKFNDVDDKAFKYACRALKIFYVKMEELKRCDYVKNLLEKKTYFNLAKLPYNSSNSENPKFLSTFGGPSSSSLPLSNLLPSA